MQGHVPGGPHAARRVHTLHADTHLMERLPEAGAFRVYSTFAACAYGDPVYAQRVHALSPARILTPLHAGSAAACVVHSRVGHPPPCMPASAHSDAVQGVHLAADRAEREVAVLDAVHVVEGPVHLELHGRHRHAASPALQAYEARMVWFRGFAGFLVSNTVPCTGKVFSGQTRRCSHGCL